MESIEQSTDGSRATRRGWAAVFAAAVGLFLSFGSIAVYSFTVFLKQLTETFGWSRGGVSFAFTCACLAGLGSVLVTGRLVDRIGGRMVAIVATALFGLSFCSLGFISGEIWQLYVIFLFLGISGGGTSAVAYSSVVSRWFDERRGLALGLTMAGTGLGSAAAPAIAQALIDAVDWRIAYIAFGLTVLLVACPVLIVWLREPARGGRRRQEKAEGVAVTGISAREARRSSKLWIMIASLFLGAAAVQGCLIHLVPLLTDMGVTAERAAFAASVFGAANLIARLGTGYLLDRIFAPYVVVAAFGAAAFGSALLLAGSAWALPATLLLGFGLGAETDAVPYLVSRYFGLRAFGEIYSNAFVTVPLGGAIGPLLVGVGFDQTGAYQIPLVCCCIALVVAALLMTRLGAFPNLALGASVGSSEPLLRAGYGAEGD
jgi:MFS family permease